mgnify:CR=1 FL=1
MADDGYTNTVCGLLRKRASLLGDIKRVEAELAAASNAVECIDRILDSLNYTGPLADQQPTGTRNLLTDRHSVSRFVLDELRKGRSQFTTRDMATQIIVLDGLDPLDRGLMDSMINRVGKVLRTLRKRGFVAGSTNDVNLMLWSPAK